MCFVNEQTTGAFLCNSLNLRSHHMKPRSLEKATGKTRGELVSWHDKATHSLCPRALEHKVISQKAFLSHEG